MLLDKCNDMIFLFNLVGFIGFIYELWILAGKLKMRTVRVLSDKYLYLAFKGFEIDTSKDGNLDDNNDVPMEEIR
ncbi:hypothetical protein G4B88_022613 [Cannabis sativa]|uniref:Uncharacterized protein n=1 Tax=Cannabis sativa TaxID=3483 RepID=A0A7J6HYQ1_CANSA|nr:hypothetical protein G4B88_022613 [Cannabis sativa]